MSKYIVKKSPALSGEVCISGAKNAVLPLLAAALLCHEETYIYDVPELKDVEIMCEIIKRLGAEIKHDADEKIVSVNSLEIKTCVASRELVEKMRASILVMGPLLARLGKAEISLPGGCAIGDRPVELHFKGLKAMGAVIDISKDGLVTAVAKDGLIGAEIYLDFPSVGATENIIMAASQAKGITVLENAAQEPEIVDLANYLNKMGAKIKGAGTDTIKIEGVTEFHAAKHRVIPDRIEAGTFMVAAAITRGKVFVNNIVPSHLKPVIAKLRECGVKMELFEDGIIVDGTHNELVSTDIKTLPYPGFPTDMQAQFLALLSTVSGSSVVIETVFENRYMHVKELNAMGADIKAKGKCAVVKGKKKLHGTKVVATDLRAGAAMVLAGLVASGNTDVHEIYHIERGYENFVEKVTKLGGIMEKVD
ncbi:MAG: UDP-N-acetylglucosamine 1-carboxyvinyltransferase [Anaerovoracaceae bacterium]